jgi:HEAT repeat protein
MVNIAMKTIRLAHICCLLTLAIACGFVAVKKLLKYHTQFAPQLNDVAGVAGIGKTKHYFVRQAGGGLEHQSYTLQYGSKRQSHDQTQINGYFTDRVSVQYRQTSARLHGYELSSSKISEFESVVENLQDLLELDDTDLAIEEARRLITHTNHFVRWSAAEALWWIGAPALPAMASMIDNPDCEIKQWIMEALFAELELLDDEHHIAHILSLTAKSTDPSVRLQSLEVFSGLASSVSFVPMSHLLEDGDLEVREMAKFNLDWIADQEFTSTRDALAWFDQHRYELDEVLDSESNQSEVDLPRERTRFKPARSP